MKTESGSPSVCQERSPRVLPLAVAGGIVGLTGWIALFPEIAVTLSWRRTLPFPLRWPTALTSHLTHWSLDHFVWDLAAFVALAFAAIRLVPTRVIPCLAIAALAIPLEISWFQAQFESYRGLSGLDSALFGLVLAALWRAGGIARGFSVAGLVAFFGKIGYESVTGETLFVDQLAGDFTPVVSAHVVGLLVGWVVGMAGSLRLSKAPLANVSRSRR